MLHARSLCWETVKNKYMFSIPVPSMLSTSKQVSTVTHKKCAVRAEFQYPSAHAHEQVGVMD